MELCFFGDDDRIGLEFEDDGGILVTMNEGHHVMIQYMLSYSDAHELRDALDRWINEGGK